MISNKRAKEVKAVVREVGVACAAAMLSISEDSVRRYLNVAEFEGAQGLRGGHFPTSPRLLGHQDRRASGVSVRPSEETGGTGAVG